MSAPLLAVRSACVRRGQETILNDLDLSVSRGSFHGLLGPNGAGKTTLLRACLGRLPLSGGSIHIDGVANTALSARTRAAALAWLPQRMKFTEPITVLDFVASARFRFNEAAATGREHAHRALIDLGIDEYATRTLPSLSGGEAQWVFLAAARAQEPLLLLLDEPASHLDPAHQLRLYGKLGAWVREGLAILCVTHDINLLAHLDLPENETHVHGLDAGNLSFSLPLDDLGLLKELDGLYGVRHTVVAVEGRRQFVPAGPRP